MQSAKRALSHYMEGDCSACLHLLSTHSMTTVGYFSQWPRLTLALGHSFNDIAQGGTGLRGGLL